MAYDVVKNGNKWEVKKGNKILGSHDSKAAAEDQRIAIALNEKSNKPGG